MSKINSLNDSCGYSQIGTGSSTTIPYNGSLTNGSPYNGAQLLTPYPIADKVIDDNIKEEIKKWFDYDELVKRLQKDFSITSKEERLRKKARKDIVTDLTWKNVVRIPKITLERNTEYANALARQINYSYFCYDGKIYESVISGPPIDTGLVEDEVNEILE